MEQTIRNLIAEGKTAKAITELRRITSSDTDLKNEVNLIAARFSEYQNQKQLGLEGHPTLTLELNNINYALLDIIDRLATNQAMPVHSVTTSVIPIKWTLVGGGLVALIAILANLATILDYLGVKPKETGGDGKPFSVVVYTHGNGGRQDILQLKETKLVADFGGRREVAKVSENGQNTFNEIPAAFRNKRIGIGLQGTEGYMLRFPDSTYLLNGEPIYLAVIQDTKTRLIKGVIKTQNGDVLVGVTITTIGESAVTDAKGYFELTIPADKQQPSYPLTLTKKGFQTATETYIPQSQVAEFRLKK